MKGGLFPFESHLGLDETLPAGEGMKDIFETFRFLDKNDYEKEISSNYYSSSARVDQRRWGA